MNFPTDAVYHLPDCTRTPPPMVNYDRKSPPRANI
jgi:hypothetical protein